MKLSLNWIKDYVDLPESIDIKKLSYDLTMSTVEVEDTIDLSAAFEGMVVGRVLEVQQHPDADKLRLCKTDLGDGVFEIVCGGSNLYNGMLVAVARPGAMVRWHGEGDLIPIGITKVRGVESYGMICASSEIGLFDLFPFTEESTIVDLSSLNSKPGTPLCEALGLSDYILEIDNKSLTNRPDLWGHYGMAREIAAIYNVPLREIEPISGIEPGDFKVIISDNAKCRRYIGVQIDKIDTRPAPLTIQTRIFSVGMRPINAIVDITNYVMLAVGQPTHAFDTDNIVNHITVRRAESGEKLLLLNGRELTLESDDLVIADDECAVGLAGVMGGSKDSVLSDTKSVILELANFEAACIRRTATRHEIRTEAATRFEKAIDPERCDLALALSLRLIKEIFPESAISGYCDVYPEKLLPAQIDVTLGWLVSRLGKAVSAGEVTNLLSRLGFAAQESGGKLHITVPTWRSTGDVSIPADIMEEVARMYGYDNFESSPITSVFESAINQVDIDLERKIKEYLAFRCGMNEIYTYPWMTDEYVSAILQSTENILQLAAPPSPNERYLRSSLLPNLVKAVSSNLRYLDEFAIFEASQVFAGSCYTKPYDEREALPYQRQHLAGAIVGSPDNITELFRRAKGILEAMPQYTHTAPFSFSKKEKPVWSDNTAWLNVYAGDIKAGILALLSKKAALTCGIKTASVILFELDIEAIEPYASRTNTFEHLPDYPMTDYDISMLFDENVKWEQIAAAINTNDGGSEYIRQTTYIDEYRGKQIPEGKKSITFRLKIGSMQKTLTSAEIETCAAGTAQRLSDLLGGEIRK